LIEIVVAQEELSVGGLRPLRSDPERSGVPKVE
jgi:hypothetical protein